MIIKYIYKAVVALLLKVSYLVSWLVTLLKFSINRVSHKNFIARGIPIIRVSLSGKMSIGRDFDFNNGVYHNMIGRQQRCFFIVGPNASLQLGNNLGFSAVAIVCHKSVIIEDDVKIGGNTVIYDTDFHSISHIERNAVPEDKSNVKTAGVVIKSGAFIGAHSTILKGVTIGINSVVGAGSVVSKSIPDNEIWAGNPARFIKKCDY